MTYTEQAENLARKLGINIELTYLGERDSWNDCIPRDVWKVCVTRGIKHFSFEFTNSQIATQTHEEPSVYDIMVCMSADSYCPSTLAELFDELYGVPYSLKSGTELEDIVKRFDISRKLAMNIANLFGDDIGLLQEIF